MFGLLAAGIASALLGAGLGHKAQRDQGKAQKKAVKQYEQQMEQQRQSRMADLMDNLNTQHAADVRGKAINTAQQQAQNRLSMLINDNEEDLSYAPLNLSDDALAARAASAAKGADLVRDLTLRYGRLEGIGNADFDRSVNDSIFNAGQGRYAAQAQRLQNQLQQDLFKASQKGGKTALAGSLLGALGNAFIASPGSFSGSPTADVSSYLPDYGKDASGLYNTDYYRGLS